MRSNLSNPAARRTADVIVFRSRIGTEISDAIRNSLPHGRRGKYDSLLKNIRDYAVFAELAAAMGECPEGSPGRTAVEDAMARAKGCHVGAPPIDEAIHADDHAEYESEAALHGALIANTPSAWHQVVLKLQAEARTLSALMRTASRRSQTNGAI